MLLIERRWDTLLMQAEHGLACLVVYSHLMILNREYDDCAGVGVGV